MKIIKCFVHMLNKILDKWKINYSICLGEKKEKNSNCLSKFLL